MSKSTGPRVNSSPIRCPYCHERVQLRGSPWVACSGCLARHHADCWMGQGGCASCMGRRALLPASSLRSTRDRLRRQAEPPRRGRALAVGALLLAVQVGVVLAGVAMFLHAETLDAQLAVAPAPEQQVGSATILDEFQVRAILREEMAGRVQQPVAEPEPSPEPEVAAQEKHGRNALVETQEADLADLRKSYAENRRKLRETHSWVIKSEMSGGINFATLVPGPRVPAIDGVVVTLTNEPVPNLPNVTRWHVRAMVAEGQVKRLTNLTASLESDLADLRKTYAAQRKTLREKELLLAMLESNGSISLRVPAPPVPAIDTTVSAVKLGEPPSPVVLSVGRNDRVERGYRFSIYRGSNFVGKVVVERVFANFSTCRVLFTAEEGQIRPGDSAATRLQ